MSDSPLTPPVQIDGEGREPIVIGYTNWRGEYALRTIKPLRLWFGSTEWHPEPQWLLKAVDVDKGAERDFALLDIGRRPAPAGRTVPDGEMDPKSSKRPVAFRVQVGSEWLVFTDEKTAADLAFGLYNDDGKYEGLYSRAYLSAAPHSPATGTDRASVLEEAARLCDPKGPRPPRDGAYAIGYFDAQHSDAAAIRALASTPASSPITGDGEAVSAPSEPDGVNEALTALEAVEHGARNLMPYLEWQLGPESPGHHPTMGSAVAYFKGQFAPEVFAPGSSRFDEWQDERRAALTPQPATAAETVSEGEVEAVEPFIWVREFPGYFDPQNGGEPPSTDFSDVEKPGYEPLFKHPAPASRRASPLSSEGWAIKPLEWFWNREAHSSETVGSKSEGKAAGKGGVGDE